MQDEIKVTQADRELFIMLLGFDAVCHEKDFHRIRKGQFDHWEKMQRIARHRHQAERETLARMEPVAWMYEYRGGVVAVTATRYDRGTIKALGYVETPLYTLPPAPEAGQ